MKLFHSVITVLTSAAFCGAHASVSLRVAEHGAPRTQNASSTRRWKGVRGAGVTRLVQSSSAGSGNWTPNASWSPYQWVRTRNGTGPAYFHMHIPKAAGLSFVRDFLKLMPEQSAMYSAEVCYNQFAQKPEFKTWLGDGIITMLRRPQDQVYSQYLECAQDRWGLKVVPPEKRYLLSNFSTWLRHFTDSDGFEEDDMQCYHPFNMQARAFVCHEQLHHMTTDLVDDILNMDAVLKNFNESKFVGLSENYKESLCLLHETLTGGLPDWCNCSGEAWHQVKTEHESHGVQEHDTKQDISPEDKLRIRKLTRTDDKLYGEALKRFKTEIARVEEKHGVKLMC